MKTKTATLQELHLDLENLTAIAYKLQQKQGITLIGVKEKAKNKKELEEIYGDIDLKINQITNRFDHGEEI